MSDNAIFVRLFVLAKDDTAAERLRGSVRQILSRHGLIVRDVPPKRYWKIPELFGVFMVLRPAARLPEAFSAILRELGSPWVEHRSSDGGDWAIWNGSPTASFLIPEARWAYLEAGKQPIDAGNGEP